MKQIMHGYESDKITLECNSKEVADIWFAVTQQLSHMESAGLEKVAVYARLKAIEDVLSGKRSVDTE